VAFNLATGVGVSKPLKNEHRDEHRELTESEFKNFHKNYILDEKGSKEFFLRTIFAAFDLNGDGVLQKQELAKFLNIFYDAKDVFKGKMRLPPKNELHRLVMGRLDKNSDGVLTFHEMKDLLEVAAVVASDSKQ
jgi:Ca2+-binding EF-hand superfamily protein